LNVINAIAPPEHRAEVISAYLVAGYVGYSLPVLAVGVVASYVGLSLSIAGAAIVLGVLALAALLVTTKRNLTASVAATG
jgi:hypothetical protein